eukprot:306509-Chlamydomonas_euryale.AAC.3
MQARPPDTLPEAGRARVTRRPAVVNAQQPQRRQLHQRGLQLRRSQRPAGRAALQTQNAQPRQPRRRQLPHKRWRAIVQRQRAQACARAQAAIH